MTGLQALTDHLKQVIPFGISGRVRRIAGLAAVVADFPAPLGAGCRIRSGDEAFVDAEVIGFDGDETLVLPYVDLAGVSRGDVVELVRTAPAIGVGDELLGRVIDGRGRPIDGGPPLNLSQRMPLHSIPTPPLERPPIESTLVTGVRAIDGLLTCGQGQRLGILAGSGLGKSTLLGQLARSSTSDVNVVVLVGERGREVREFLERDLGREGLARSVVVAATSDESALLRQRAAFLGAAMAEFFRNRGQDVLLLLDSVSRVASAAREIGLAAGEQPVTRGFPPSVFAMLPRLLERSGRTTAGSITGFYTVLVERDDENDPVAESVRAILDGHLVLSRELAERAHWPAIDVLASISRSMTDLADDNQQRAADDFRAVLSARRDADDLVSVGAYQHGANRLVDAALEHESAINDFLRQHPTEMNSLDATLETMTRLVADLRPAEPDEGQLRTAA
ncbi:MAG TPA: EscN/YscN/HrcN family type III secretion system ATPase [Planctomycetaceae bacterium]|nr:EscN/YscN/HrcN family type III secretion system ATPase [Planctomycetaceae bacterium]HCD01027.1 EscN/YscN/HrcN family type III secretion system ATPase [Planctomycetaceae bacterium]|tara:strand:- start:304 stop:1656 length:1353 start_codon:yes stop_codon:yes gene_type:complete